MLYAVELRKTAPECNPEYTYLEVEAEVEQAACEIAVGLAADRNTHPGWRSAAEPEHWGKPDGYEVIACAPATDEIRTLRKTMHFPVSHVAERASPVAAPASKRRR